MPLVAYSELPAFDALKQEGGTVIAREIALHQDIRELHIGLLNMMPDAA
ncbi:MAG TPA: homoserine O-succinyltransferase, partial [Gammaproteobacteria bacterium]|nr:homoserine O-succinyltransferase [Gammaproteobacteria bacterium]